MSDLYRELYLDKSDQLLKALHVSIELTKRLKNAEQELKVTNELLERYDALLIAIPECPEHGKCLPHALEWIEKMKAVQQNVADV